MAAFREYYLPYSSTYNRDKDLYLAWDSAFDSASDDHYHNRPVTSNYNCQTSCKYYNPSTQKRLGNSISESSRSGPVKRKCCGVSLGCCALTFLALVIILALVSIVGFSIYLAMITHVHLNSSTAASFTKSDENIDITIRSRASSSTISPIVNDPASTANENILVTPLTDNPLIPSTNPSIVFIKRTEKRVVKLEPQSKFVGRTPFVTTSAPQMILAISKSVQTRDSIIAPHSSMIDGFLVPMTVPKSANEERFPKYIAPALYQAHPNNDIIIETVGNNEEITDEPLYEDQISSSDNLSSTLSPINWDLLTTTGLSFCMQNEFQCDSGQCLSARALCNRRIECNDGSDERNCSCAQYLKAERQFNKICDGIIDCYDSSDEMNCAYCKQNYPCPGSHVCINKSQICDGSKDCPNGDDESQCISLVSKDKSADRIENYLNDEGALYIRHKGELAPLCLDDLNVNFDERSNNMWKIEDLGEAICRANSYSELQSIQMIGLNHQNSKLFFKIEVPISSSTHTSSSLSVWGSLFEKSECLSKKIAYVKCKDFECGVRSVPSGKRQRIIGGQSASQGSWPWQVALYKEGEFQCGGVIIDSQWLLTAAHCFQGTRDAYWTARFGTLRRGNVFANPYEQLRRITHILVHNHYVDKGFINDIALLRLDSPINYSKHIRPVCMPTESDDVSKWHRQLCTTVGWGKLFEHGRVFPDELQEVKLPVISTEECRKRTLFLPLYKITDNMFCAGYDRGGRDACLGDSGGPLMCQKENGKWFLLGLTSNGDGCGRAGRPGVYTKVVKYRDWIETIIKSELEPEIKRTCDGLRCPLGRCLKTEQICDRIMDCRDASDEQNCTDYSNHTVVNRNEN